MVFRFPGEGAQLANSSRKMTKGNMGVKEREETEAALNKRPLGNSSKTLGLTKVFW